MDFILERLHKIRQRIVLKSGKSYTCGRGKGNTIVCLGLQVSRKHCVFFHATDKLFVTDLKSSNGIFINGIVQEPYQMVQLHQDDIIGIGCSDVNPNDTTLFAYKIYITKTPDLELVSTNDMSLAVPISDTMVHQKQSNSNVDDASKNKRRVSSNNCDMPLPCKIPKYTNNNEINFDDLPGPSTDTSIVQNNNSNINDVRSETAIHIKQENDIEIIHTTFAERKDMDGDIENHFLKSYSYETCSNINIKSEDFHTDNKMDISIDENSEDNSDNNKAVNDEHTTKGKINIPSKTNDTDIKIIKFIPDKDRLIKLEDELQLTDEDEEAHLAVVNNKAIYKTTPIKLKKIKHEPKTRYSEIDVVDLSDDEDGIFPYSQLFDIKFEGNVKQEIEIKQECVSNDIEKIPLDIDDEIIVLTDSEDDDNSWLHRLSRSQLMNENRNSGVMKLVIEDEIDLRVWQTDVTKITQDAIPSTSKDFNKVIEGQAAGIDLGICQKDDVTKITQDAIPSTSKNFNKVIEGQSAGIDVFEDSNSRETPLERTSIDKKTKRGDDNNLSMPKTDAMDTNDDGPSNELNLEPNLENTDYAVRQKTDAKQSAEPRNKQAETSPTNTKYKSRCATTKRVIPLIEAPHLPARKGRTKSSDHKKDSSDHKKDSSDHKKDSSKECSKVSKTSEEISLSRTTEENRMQKLTDKLEDHFYNKEQSKGTSKGSPDHTSSKQNRTSISKEEKKIIIEERKAKLKKIAEEEKLVADNNKSVKRGNAKPKVKVSQKNRGDFLCNEQEAHVSKPSSTTKSAERVKLSNKANRATSYDADVLESRTQNIEISKSHKEDISKNTVNNVATSLEQSLSINNGLEEIKLPEKYNGVKDSNMNSNMDKKYDNNKKKHKNIENTTNFSENTASKSTEIFAECISVSNKENSLSPKVAKTKKGVTFSTIVNVKEFATESENEMTQKLSKIKANVQCNPKLEEFLLRIFMWNPVWLEEQRYLKTEPPIVPTDELQHMKVRYDSYSDYYKVALPLMLLETWHRISKEFETVARNSQYKTAMCSIVTNSITRIQIPITNSFLTALMLEVLVTAEDLDRKSHPKFGDLVSFEYVQHTQGKQTFHKVFGYITSMNKMIISDFTHYNRELKKYVRNAHAVMTYSIQTRPIEHEILLNRVQRVRTITYLRSDMRMVQALQYLPQSPLLDLILDPKIEDYQLPSFDTSCTSLVTKEKLNPKQLDTIFRITKAVIRNETKLCFIHGPPGTGKSKVIVNLVAQILYGERENKNDKIKILLCAPSNAAIDEIVTRLLVIRANLKQQYNYTFNLVRIGQLECMNAAVKVVSPSELARRHLRKFTEGVVTWSANSTTNYAIEKIKLETLMNEYQVELNNALSLSEARRRTIRRKLTDTSSKYELLISKQLFDDINPKDRARFQRSTEDIILAGADIIACTLSSCYTNQMESIFGPNREKLSVCIVDEATQSCEAETLIPLMLGVNTMVLVGDPNQLPATILSQRAKKLGLDQSIFSRVQHAFSLKKENPIIMLDTQYRMAYSISYWPNRYFYDGRLKNAIENRLSFPFQRYRVLCHNSIQNNDKFSNTTEAEFVANMIYAMLIYAKWENTNESITLGVLTPYNNQRTVILNKINEKIFTLPENMKKKITYEVNTVDSFQGQERDIIIMSCVRSHGIGFLSDKQRLCVALTRAKHSLILCGNFNAFMKDHMWKSLLADARSRGVLFDVDANATSTIIKQFVVK